ncbi:MAG: TetR/AcrR family transcriptional regulator [Xenococcaceae cyanobacterium MO_167.B52]|nr:TetR/AcrR family transcriptional regulator [Xenococcaceae cyanobacterium MO_167.B52]
MSKAEQTKARIIEQAAILFNQKGYAGVSISDIMQVTGLKKGGIYNHFDGKDELAIAAFDYAVNLVTKKVWHALKQEEKAIARLKALLDIHLDYIDEPPLPGGCPIMNTAIEWDDAHSVMGNSNIGIILRDRSKQAMDSWCNLIIAIVKKGIKKGEIKPTVESDTVATILISSIEGGIMISKLYQDSIHLKRVIANLHIYLDNLALV